MNLGKTCVGVLSVFFIYSNCVFADDIELLTNESKKIEGTLLGGEQFVKIEYNGVMNVGYYDASVAQLRERLVDEGYGAIDEADPYLYDETLKAAVSFYQEDHGLKPDGVAGMSTISALNDNGKDRYDKLIYSISELKKIDLSGRKKTIIVNIPTFNLRAYDGADVFIDSKVIVGSKSRKTPLMKTKLTQLKINPDWTVPVSILKKDYLRKIKNFKQASLSSRGYYVADGKGDVVDFELASEMSSEEFINSGYQLKQSSGDNNALGRIKFVLKNSDSIYLHDTNNKSLFNRANRDLSSGCIRVENYMELASWVYGGYISDIEEKINTGKTMYINTIETDVYFTYLPVFVVNGKVVYANDVYGEFKF